MKATHDETYPPTISETPPLQKSRRFIAAAAIRRRRLGGRRGRSLLGRRTREEQHGARYGAPADRDAMDHPDVDTHALNPAVVGTAGADLTQSQLRLGRRVQAGHQPGRLQQGRTGLPHRPCSWRRAVTGCEPMTGLVRRARL